MMFFFVAIGAQQYALFRFGKNRLHGSIGERPKVKVEGLLRFVFMMKFKSGEIASVAATNTTATFLCYKQSLTTQSPGLLSLVRLVAIIGPLVLAFQRAKPGLPTAQFSTTDCTQHGRASEAKLAGLYRLRNCRSDTEITVADAMAFLINSGSLIRACSSVG